MDFRPPVQGWRPAPLGAGDLGGAARVLAEALADSPLSLRVLRGRSRSARVRSTRIGLTAQLPAARRSGRVLCVREGAALRGALVGAAPHAHPFPSPPLLRRFATALGQGLGASGRWSEVFEALLAARPDEPHWYLALLGVHPSLQGRGAGSALLAAWLQEVDAAGGAAWLETDDPRNLAFYRGARFEPRGELTLLGVPVWLLWRPPSPGPHGADFM